MLKNHTEKLVALEIESICQNGFCGELNSETAKFLQEWLEAGNSGTTLDAQIIWAHLIETCPAKNVPSCLYRGCETVINGKIESYTPKHDVATKFADQYGILIIVDKECLFEKKNAFDLTGFLTSIYEQIFETGKYPWLVDFIEMWGYEQEYLLRTDSNNFCIYKSVSKPQWILEG